MTLRTDMIAHEKTHEYTKSLRALSKLVLKSFCPTGAPPLPADFTDVCKLALCDGALTKDPKILCSLLRVFALHTEGSYCSVERLDAKVANVEAASLLNMEQVAVDLKDLKQQLATMKVDAAAASRRQAETEAAATAAQAAAAELKQRMSASRSYVDAVDQGAWQHVGRRGRVQAQTPPLPPPPLFDVRVEAVRDSERKIPVTDQEATVLTHALALSMGFDESHIHGGYIQPGKGGTGIAVVLKVTPRLAQALFKEGRKPTSEQQDDMQGWRVKRHMQAAELRCVKAIWEEFGAVLTAAKTSNVLYKYINNYTAVQIGDTTHYLKADNMPATQA